MNIKYTKDGKRVVVIGKLNNQETIVQEIFVANGEAFPGGENFVVTGLLDKPAETYQAREEARCKKTLAELTANIGKARQELQDARQDASVQILVNRIIDKWQNNNLSELETLFDFLGGRITHVVLEGYNDYKIERLADALKDTSDCKRFEGLKLITLFGCDQYGSRHSKPDTGRLDWRLNRYKDGSGYSTTIQPCTSYEAAREWIDKQIADKDATDKLIVLKKKYSLVNPTDIKIAEWEKKCYDDKCRTISKKQAELQKLKDELEALS